MQLPVSSVFRKKVKFDIAAEFLAACASGDTEEAKVILEEAKQTKRRNGEDTAAIINCSNADGITALHQVKQFLPLRFYWLVNKKLCSFVIFFFLSSDTGLHRRQHRNCDLPFGAGCQCEPGWQWGMDGATCCCLLRPRWHHRVCTIAEHSSFASVCV